MAKYHRILAAISLKCNALKGPVAGDLATTYETVTLTQANFKSTNFPFAAFKDLLRVTESEIALAVANNENHLWRSIISDKTSPLVSGVDIPPVGASNLPIIGVVSGVSEFPGGKRLTSDFTLDEIRRLIDNPNGWRKINPYQFFIDYPQIYFTVTNVTVDVCVWSPDGCDTAIAANGDLLFPDAEGAYMSGLGSKMGNLDPQFAGLAAGFAPEFTAWLTALSGGKTKP